MARRSIFVFAVVLAHMLFFDRGMGGDGWTTFAFTESLVIDGDPWLENNERGVRNGMIPIRGHLVMQYPPGISILDVLPYTTARALDAMLPGTHSFSIPPVGTVSREIFL